MQIARVFFNVHMGQNFQGLLRICRDNRLKPEQNPESYVVFINTAKTKFKLLIGDKYLVYHSNGNKVIPLDAIQFLPHAFTGREFKFDAAIEKLVRNKLNQQVV